jgi:putative transposase
MCWLARVSRASYYRSWQAAEPDAEEMELRDATRRIVLEHRSYGYRRVTAQLRQEARVVNHKRVARLMRDHNLLARRIR